MARVLIADGDAVERDLLADALAAAGHSVAAAAGDGHEALAAAERARPDVAILGLLLPPKDGFTLLLHLRASDAARAMPVIFVSSEPATAHEATALDLGAARYLEKPWSGAELAAAIAEALA